MWSAITGRKANTSQDTKDTSKDTTSKDTKQATDNKQTQQIQHAPIIAIPVPLGRPTLHLAKMIKWGWARRHIDHLNDEYHPLLTVEQAATLPKTMDLRPGMMPPYDQGQIGSCVANGTGGAVEYDRIKQGCPPVTPARLMIYYNGRAINGSIDQDSGITIHEGVQALIQQGVCPETEWPYIESQFAVKPTDQCYADALKCKVMTNKWVEQIAHAVCGVLSGVANNGVPLPVLVGVQVYSSFMSDEVMHTGVVPMPQKGQAALGGHCILLVGYDADKQVFIFRNSWGTTWGMGGYGTIPFAYILSPKLAAELGTISSITPAACAAVSKVVVIPSSSASVKQTA